MDRSAIHEELEKYIKNNTLEQRIINLELPDQNRLPDNENAERNLTVVFGKLHGDLSKELNKRVETTKKEPTLGEYLENLMQEKKKSQPVLNMRAGISKEYWYKATKGKIKPTKSKLMCIAIGLRLSLAETEQLLRKAGYSLATNSSTFDTILGFFIEKEIYDTIDIDGELEEHGQPTIFSIQ